MWVALPPLQQRRGTRGRRGRWHGGVTGEVALAAVLLSTGDSGITVLFRRRSVLCPCTQSQAGTEAVCKAATACTAGEREGGGHALKLAFAIVLAFAGQCLYPERRPADSASHTYTRVHACTAVDLDTGIRWICALLLELAPLANLPTQRIAGQVHGIGVWAVLVRGVLTQVPMDALFSLFPHRSGRRN